MQLTPIKSGMPSLDGVLQNFRLGDNVVWQVDDLQDYLFFARPFADQSISDGRRCIYIRFAPHELILHPRPGLTIIEVDPSPGFDTFSSEVNSIIQKNGTGVFYVFDNLSALVEDWATDELLANFFQVSCPLLAKLDTVAYFALTRGKHSHSAVARIRDTTQVLIDVFHVKGKFYIHPLKVWDRYSSQMFLPHVLARNSWTPVFQSDAASEVTSTARKHPFNNSDNLIAPWDSVYRRLIKLHETGAASPEKASELTALKQELSRMMIGNHPVFNRLADSYLTMDDLFNIRNRLIGSGRIGGKAAGMLLARRILEKVPGKIDFSQVMEEHDSFYIGSDVFFSFLVNNNLFQLKMQLSKQPRLSHEEFEEVEQRFLAGCFPVAIMEQFRDLLDYFGQAPIIVRSSSLLEDSFGNAFAGKYRSEFCANQGSPEDRLREFTKAIKLVYASALNPDALAYRHHHGLGENDEQMAILVQRVSGMPYRGYFFPTMAGVAFSRNLFAWNDRIDPAKGIIRLVFGLGTRAVNRVGRDYPRMISVSHPQLRPETGLAVAKYSQREIDLLDLTANQFATRPVAAVLEPCDYPNLHLLISLMQDGYPQDPISREIGSFSDAFVLTFGNLLRQTSFVPMIEEMLAKLEHAYGYPIDTEFTASVDAEKRVKINLLQCRPMQIPGRRGPVTMPSEVDEAEVLFRANRVISGGVIDNIRYIIYISPARYSAINELSLKKSLGRLVGRINQHPSVSGSRFIMMGPGRWGSSNINLGVNVSYADIDNTSVLVEIAREEENQLPEVSYGTHFFQDLVEANIIYLPVYPDDPKSGYNHVFFNNATNVLREIVPEAAELENLVRIIDVPRATKGKYAHVVADPHTRKAICYLKQHV